MASNYADKVQGIKIIGDRDNFSFTVTVIGVVQKPGVYLFDKPVNFLEIMDASGLITEGRSQSHIFKIRLFDGENNELSYVNYAIIKNNPEHDFEINNMSVLFVTESLWADPLK
mgnify:CR=1 FL=1